MSISVCDLLSLEKCYNFDGRNTTITTVMLYHIDNRLCLYPKASRGGRGGGREGRAYRYFQQERPGLISWHESWTSNTVDGV